MPRHQPTAEEVRRRLRSVDRLAGNMDEAFKIPGTNIRFGWDSIVGLMPGVGDSVTLISQAYLMWHAYRIGIRKRTWVRLIGNALADFLIGSIPALGDIFDVFFRSNRRNADLLAKEIRHLHGNLSSLASDSSRIIDSPGPPRTANGSLNRPAQRRLT